MLVCMVQAAGALYSNIPKIYIKRRQRLNKWSGLVAEGLALRGAEWDNCHVQGRIIHVLTACLIPVGTWELTTCWELCPIQPMWRSTND